MAYWLHVRRALARQPVERIGLGGYLHLTRGFSEFVDAIELMGRQFRRLKALHIEGAPATLPIRVAVLHAWGSLRSWTLSGHFHETNTNPLIHINEALSGLPVDVRFIDFEQAAHGGMEGVDVLINAGFAGDAWSGGDAWRAPELVAEITRFVHTGGSLIGVAEPSACTGGDTCFRLAHVLGVDMDDGEYACHAPWRFEVGESPIPVFRDALAAKPEIRLIDPDTQVLAALDGAPQMTLHRCGRGCAAYLSGFSYSPEAARMLLELLLYLTGKDGRGAGYCGDPMVETVWFPASNTLVVMNDSEKETTARVEWPCGSEKITLSPLELRFIEH